MQRTSNDATVIGAVQPHGRLRWIARFELLDRVADQLEEHGQDLPRPEAQRGRRSNPAALGAALFDVAREPLSSPASASFEEARARLTAYLGRQDGAHRNLPQAFTAAATALRAEAAWLARRRVDAERRLALLYQLYVLGDLDPRSVLQDHGVPTSFGVDFSQVDEWFRWARELDYVRIEGTGQERGYQITSRGRDYVEESLSGDGEAPAVPTTMPHHIFYSWQSDVTPGAACRSFIQGALATAIDALAKDATLDASPRLDQDTQGVGGSVDIMATILQKIDRSAAFVADVTLVGTTISGKPTPNPSVLVELGYALKRHAGWEKILMVMNTSFGGGITDLPFDLRGKKVIAYASPPDAKERAAEKKALTARLTNELRAMLGEKTPPQVAPETAPEVTLTINHETKPGSRSNQFIVTITNTSNRRIDDWEVELHLPTPLKHGHYSNEVKSRSDHEQTVFLTDGKAAKMPLRPRAKHEDRIEYVITDDIRRDRESLLTRPVHAHALVDGEIVAEVDGVVADYQDL